MQTSTAASKKKVPPMGRTPSTTHRWHFCRVLYLQPSNQKLFSLIMQTSTALFR